MFQKQKRKRIIWPDRKSFAFSIFDDTDGARIENVAPVYELLSDLGIRTTKSVWPSRGIDDTSLHPVGAGATCEDRDYLDWVLKLQRSGFEIGYHMNTFHTSTREETLTGLDHFKSLFGHDPDIMANHASNREAIYWGDARIGGLNRLCYNVLNRFKKHDIFRGHVEGDPLFWGDLCQDRIRYVRNFVFTGINTLRACPLMPYHDPSRPYVNEWFASSNGANAQTFVRCLGESEQDRLEAEGGLCIMYTHFAKNFCDADGKVTREFKGVTEKLSRRNGWFAPVATILDYIREQRGPRTISADERRGLERAWLIDRVTANFRRQ